MTTADNEKKLATFNFNGKLINAKPEQTIIQAAMDHGMYIPYLCYHPGLDPYGACRMCVVETEKGEKVESLKVNVNSVGDASTVSLRPERVEINSSDSSFENSFEAKVKELIYLGDHIRTRVEVCGNDQFIVKVPNSYKGANLKEGTSVKLSWKASDSRALDLR